MKKLPSIVPTQSLVYFLICGVGILVFVILIIIPSQRASAQLDEDIVNLKRRIEEQRILRPVFDSLLKKAKKKNTTGLPATKSAKLARGDINKVSARLQDMARKHELELQEIRTDVDNLAGKSGYLVMRLNLKGDFLKFRDFLVDLGTIEALEHIGELEIRAVEGSREFKLKIWLAQK